MAKLFPNLNFKGFWEMKLGPRRRMVLEEAFFYYIYLVSFPLLYLSTKVYITGWGRWIILSFLISIVLIELLLHLPASQKASNPFKLSSVVTLLPTFALALWADYLRRAFYIYYIKQNYEGQMSYAALGEVQLSTTSLLLSIVALFLSYHYYKKERNMQQRLLFAFFLCSFIFSFGGA